MIHDSMTIDSIRDCTHSTVQFSEGKVDVLSPRQAAAGSRCCVHCTAVHLQPGQGGAGLFSLFSSQSARTVPSGRSDNRQLKSDP